jgi:putative tricarboxylic transport membrane protein
MIQGLVPGPLFMQQNAPMLYALFIVLIISNLFTFTVGTIFLKLVNNLSNIPRQFLYPAVIVFGVIGAFVFRSTLFDVKIMIFLGVFGYVLAKFDIPLPPILVSFILGEILEKTMRQSLLISRGNLSIFITHPISLTFLILTIAVVVLLGVKSKKSTKNSN